MKCLLKGNFKVCWVLQSQCAFSVPPIDNNNIYPIPPPFRYSLTSHFRTLTANFTFQYAKPALKDDEMSDSSGYFFPRWTLSFHHHQLCCVGRLYVACKWLWILIKRCHRHGCNWWLARLSNCMLPRRKCVPLVWVERSSVRM